jgi:hypothetical protein
MAHQEVLRHVPTARVPEAMQGFKDAGATTVTKEDEGAGMWTVTATFPD